MVKNYNIGDTVLLLRVLEDPDDRSSKDYSNRPYFRTAIGKPITVDIKDDKRYYNNKYGIWFCDEDVMPLTELGAAIYG